MYIEEEIREKVQRLILSTPPTMTEALGIEFLFLSRAKLEARMPLSENTRQPFGLLHGGASAALAETLASIGGVLNVDEAAHQVVGIELNASHLRAVTSGCVIGTAVPLRLGKNVQFWEIRIRNEANEPICLARCTLAVVPVRRQPQSGEKSAAG